jgi:hypothetical protein
MGGVWYGMVKKSRESFWCFRGHGVEFFKYQKPLAKKMEKMFSGGTKKMST